MSNFDSLPRSRSLRRMYSSTSGSDIAIPSAGSSSGSAGPSSPSHNRRQSNLPQHSHHPHPYSHHSPHHSRSDSSSSQTLNNNKYLQRTGKRTGQNLVDAAAQAEWNEKKWVWVPDDGEGYIAGWVIKEETVRGEGRMEGRTEEISTVGMVNDQTKSLPTNLLCNANPPKFDRAEDIADLTFLNEASVVHNLKRRAEGGLIYTYSGLFLVAVNPYHPLPIYGSAVVQQYKNRRRDENPPHIYAIAERAWQNMVGEREGQSILITGESGAGKTENTKRCIQYLAAIASDTLPASGSAHSVSEYWGDNQPSQPGHHQGGHGHGKESSWRRTAAAASGGQLGLLERQILQANPILESFGNAQTVRNNNSSRFGKFVRIFFSSGGSIAGANIDWYLLEKSRVTRRSENERNFHVFYQLLRGGGRELKRDLLLTGSVGDYEYLKGSRKEVDGVDDGVEYGLLKDALDTVGFSPQEQRDLFRVIAAILHVGNIIITADRSDQAQIRDNSQLEKVCHLLGLSVQELSKALLRPRVKAGREWVTQARTKGQVVDEIAAMCKTIYERSFGSLVDRINKALDRPASKSTFIGVLDIAGFEIFQTNGFEQLCINYTNEKLQQFFNHHMFVLEQEEYARESIEWDFVNFGLDLQPTIDLIESTNPIGILSCLDEECIMPKASDQTFTEKLDRLVKSGDPTVASKYSPARFDQGFSVKHYAGKVEYRTEGWLDRNRDPLNDNLTSVLANSTDRYISTLFADYREDDTAEASGPKRRVKRGAFRTVGQRHKEQLASLMSQLQATQPHFVRCIVPNPHKKPGIINVPLVLDQLRCNGVLEGIRIARLGYPNRLPFIEFRQRYEVLTPGIIPKGYMDGRKACLRMVEALDLDSSTFKIGLSKIFFKAGILAELEERRDEHLYDIFARLQAACRMFSARRQIRKILNRAAAVRTIQRNARIYNELRGWPWWQLYSKVRPLLAATRSDEELKRKELELAMANERASRDENERKKLEELRASLELEKKKVEDAFEAERALAIDKDSLLARSKKREGELEEELLLMQQDLDTLDSHLERALKAQKAGEQQYSELKVAFDEAAQHLLRLEGEQQHWASRETTLTNQANAKSSELEKAIRDRDTFKETCEELQRSVVERTEDLHRAQKRMQTAVAEAEGKLANELKDRDSLKGKVTALEKELTTAKEQLAEMRKTASGYENIVTRKDSEVISLQNQLQSLRRDHQAASKHQKGLELHADGLAKQIEDKQVELDHAIQSRRGMERELDSMRDLVEKKASEEEKRAEVANAKDNELLQLRTQLTEVSTDLASMKRDSSAMIEGLQMDLQSAQRELATASSGYSEQSKKAAELSSKLSASEQTVAKIDRSRKAIEVELQELRAKHLQVSNDIDSAIRDRDRLQRDLGNATAKFQEKEDALVSLERERSNWTRQVDNLKQQLSSETSKRAQLETVRKELDMDLTSHQKKLADYEREYTSLRKELQATNKELAKAKSMQDKTIVEHVHVLEEAKRYTDRQLSDSQSQLRDLTNYTRTLEKTKTRLTGEVEDLSQALERERQQERAVQKATRGADDPTQKVLRALETEKAARQAAESTVRKLESELQRSKSTSSTPPVVTYGNVKPSRSHSESQVVKTPVDDGAMLKMKQQYEGRIAELERRLANSASSDNAVEKVKRHVERQQASIRRLMSKDVDQDDSARARLLKDLLEANQDLEREMTAKLNRPMPDIHAYVNSRPQSPAPRGAKVNGLVNGFTNRASRDFTDSDRSRFSDEAGAKQERAIQSLQADLHVRELQMSANGNVRKQLENQVQMMNEMLSSNHDSLSKETREKLGRENARLSQLLQDEVHAREEAEQARLRGSQALSDLHSRMTQQLNEQFVAVDERSKRANEQRRLTQAELDDHRHLINELTRNKKALLEENVDLKARIEAGLLQRNEESAEKRELLAQVQDLQMHGASDSSLQQALGHYKAKMDSLANSLEAAEVAKIKAEKGESFTKLSLADAEKLQSELLSQRRTLEERLAETQQRCRELEGQLEEEGGDMSSAELDRRRLRDSLESERDQYKKDLEERDFAAEATRKKYQSELETLSTELQMERDAIVRLREENRRVKNLHDNLQIRYDDDVLNMSSWKKEKERMESKLSDVNKAFDEARTAQGEASAQIVTLMSQVRDLRNSLEEMEADNSALQQTKRTLEKRLNDIGDEYLHANQDKLSSDRVLQALDLERQDLKHALEELQDRIPLALEKQKKAEAWANECQIEAARERDDANEAQKLNATLEKQVKELQNRLVDMETRSYASSPRPPGAERKRVDELSAKLETEQRERTEVVKASRRSDRLALDLQSRLNDQEKMRNRLEVDLKNTEERVMQLRKVIENLQNSESEAHLSARRAEREASDQKERALKSERELERYKTRLEARTTPGLESPYRSAR